MAPGGTYFYTVNLLQRHGNDLLTRQTVNLETAVERSKASWLNQIEVWFGILQRKALRGASFESIDKLTQAIKDFTAAYNKNASPFVWRKRKNNGAQLRNIIVNLCNETLAVCHDS